MQGVVVFLALVMELWWSWWFCKAVGVVELVVLGDDGGSGGEEVVSFLVEVTVAVLMEELLVG